MDWDPDQYLRFSDQRELPFRHLVAALEDLNPATVVDLGCGTGALTATLTERWPQARITGIDSSPEMIARAGKHEVANRLVFYSGDVSIWRAPKPVDLMVSNACFHWIDDHAVLLDHLLLQLAPGGTLAFQVPANHDAPSHTILRDLCANKRWRDRLDGNPRTGVRNPRWYHGELGGRGLAVAVWQTIYHHVLEGENPVLEWMRGTTLRPLLAHLPDDRQEEFLAEYGALVDECYPAREGRTAFPFTRTFVVASGSRKE